MASSVMIDPGDFREVIQQAIEEAFREMEARRSRDESGAVLWDKRTAARELGMSTSTLDRLRGKGLPHVKLDGKVWFRPSSLDAWAAQHETTGG